jgi:CRISPR-associated Cas5-like protein
VLQVTGDFALFGRAGNPLNKVSYSFPTPGSARGLCKALYHNNFYIPVLRKTEILRPLRMTCISHTLFRAHTLPAKPTYDRHGDKTIKAPYTHVFLQDVAYRFHLDIYAADDRKVQRLERAIRQGAAHCAPYLGLRDCIAQIVPVDDTPPAPVYGTEAAMLIGQRPALVMAQNGIVEYPEWTLDALLEQRDYRYKMEGAFGNDGDEDLA